MTGCDVVTFHVPSNKHTKKMVNAKLLSLMNDGGYVINTSRGEIIDDSENEFYKVIKDKNLRVAFDVYPTEPGSNDKTFTDNNISKNQNIYGTHHIGASTEQVLFLCFFSLYFFLCVFIFFSQKKAFPKKLEGTKNV